MSNDDDLIKCIARAMCVSGGYDPDEIMANDGPRWKYYAEQALAAIAAMQPHIAAEREDAARRALEATLPSVCTDRTIEAHGAHCCCTTCELNIAENEIRAIDPAQFREAGNG